MTRELPDGCVLGYTVLYEAWYGELASDREISVSAAAPGGGCAWEFIVEEIELGGQQCARVKVFDDAFAAFVQIPEFFIALAERKPNTTVEVIRILNGLGARDLTERDWPAAYRRTNRPALPQGIHDRLVSYGWTPPTGDQA